MTVKWNVFIFFRRKRYQLDKREGGSVAALLKFVVRRNHYMSVDNW